MFAPQKGAGAAMVEALDAWMSQLCEVYSEFSGRDIRTVPGSGAAGGTGGAIRSCMGASMTPGAFQLLDEAGMGPLLDTCTLVITGEGHADLQTLRGKVPAGVLEYVRKYDSECGGSRHTQVALVAGQVSDRDALLRAGFDYVVEATPEGMPISLAMDPATARENIKKAVGIIAHGLDR
jgi:glycerate kinase